MQSDSALAIKTPIFLIGFMGSGKTTLGRALANRLSLKFVDLDKEIEEQLKMPISDIFGKYGESYFRNVEAKALRRWKHQKKCVIATGGGTPCQELNMQWIKENGSSIYLQMTPEALLSRLNQNEQATRPLLKDKTSEELLSFIKLRLSERTPFYKQADYTVNGLKIKPDELVELLSGGSH